MNTTHLPRSSGWLAALLFSLAVPAAAQTLPAHYRQTNNIPYVTGGQSRQWLDLYHIPTATNPTPVVVWLHGGGWLSGNENLPRALALTNHNVAVAAISYRYTTNAVASGYPATLPHPAQIHDVKAALRWLRANAAQFNLDTNRIGIWGYSSGGHLAALAGTTGHTNLFDVGENLGQSSAVQAVADMSGPANIGLATANQATENFLTLLLGAPATSNPPTLATVNPMSHVRPGAPPFLIIHGETDPSVAIAHSEQLHNALTNTGLSSLFVRLPGTGHEIPASQDPLTAQWLATNLTAVSVTVTNAPYTNDLAALSDEFNDASTLANYQRVNSVEGWNADKLEARDINVSRTGRMTMLPRTGGWFNDYIGELSFKPVSGDFVVTTEVIPRNRAGTAAPSGEYSLAGLMIRTPTAHTTGATGWQLGQQNYVFLSMGAASNPGTYQFEVKNTLNSSSVLAISNAPAAQAEIQIARLGGAVITLRRDAGGQWLVHRRYSRNDLPAALQVGLVAYTDWLGIQARFPIAQPGSYLAQNAAVITDQNPGLRAEFEYLRYHRPQIPANLAGRDFTNPAQVSDAELLAFLGANANTPATNAPPNVAPVLTTNPQSQTVNVGANVLFSAAAPGTPTPTFQWQRSGTNLPGATGATLTLNSVQVSDAGIYSVVASNVAGLATSPAATLTVNVPATPPAVTSQPTGAVVVAGSNFTFTVSASGTPPLNYQWLRNSVALPDATSATLALTSVARTNTGSYVVQITGPGGATTSQPAGLRVLNSPRLQSPLALPGGAFRLHFNDHDGGALTLGDAPNFEVWVSTNLVTTNWLRLNLPLTITNGLLTLDDADAPNHPRRFYRVLER